MKAIRTLAIIGAITSLAGSAMARSVGDEGQEATILDHVCVTNSCSTDRAADASKKRAEARAKAEAMVHAEMTLQQSSRLPMSSLPQGRAVDLKGSIRTPDGTLVPVDIIAHQGFSNMDQSGDYLIGGSAVADDGGLTIHTAVMIGDQVTNLPLTTLPSGGSTTATLPDGSQLTLTATLRDATPGEAAKWGATAAAMAAGAAAGHASR